MKRCILLVLLFFLTSMAVKAQSIDIVYLDNGSIIRGSIIEMTTNESVKIKTSDGSIFVYPIDQVLKIEKSSESNDSDLQGINFNGKMIDRHKRYLCWADTKDRLTVEDFQNFLGPDLYNTYSEASKQFKAGKNLLTWGIICAFGGTVCLIESVTSNDSDLIGTGIGLSAIYLIPGNVMIGLGCVFKGIGKGRLEWIKETYNNAGTMSSNIQVSPSVFKTSNDSYALGATLSWNF